MIRTSQTDNTGDSTFSKEENDRQNGWTDKQWDVLTVKMTVVLSCVGVTVTK